MKRQIVMCTFALAAVVAPSFGPTAAEARAKQIDAGESRVQANGITIAYRSYGSADRETILLIMGVGGQLTEWPAELPAELVKRGYRVVIYDTLVPVDASRDVAANIPGAELRVIPNMGHNLPGPLVPVIADAIVSAATRARQSARGGSPR